MTWPSHEQNAAPLPVLQQSEYQSPEIHTLKKNSQTVQREEHFSWIVGKRNGNSRQTVAILRAAT